MTGRESDETQEVKLHVYSHQHETTKLDAPACTSVNPVSAASEGIFHLVLAGHSLHWFRSSLYHCDC